MAKTMSAAPRVDTHRPADAMYVVADMSGMSGDLDLRTISKRPAHAPQRIWLSAGGTAVAAVLTPEQGGTNMTVTVPANSSLEIMHPINKLIKSGSGAVQVVAYWWADHNVWNV